MHALFFSICSLFILEGTLAQVKQPFANPSLFYSNLDSLIKNAEPVTMPVTSGRKAARPAGITGACNTSTFYMHLTGGVGKKIQLREIQTMTDGNFLLGGNITLANSEEEGLLCVMSNAGSVIAQKQVRINNKPTTIFSIKTMFNGQVAIAGIVHETTDKVFVSLLNSDLSVSWLQTVDISGPVTILLDVIDDSKFHVAAQAGNTISYFLLDNTGAMVWSNQLNVAGLDNLAGVGHNSFSGLMLSLNCTIAGKKQVKLISVAGSSGNIVSSGFLGDGTAENMAGKTTSFSNRVITTGITKTSAGQFMLSRQIMNDALQTETVHEYTIPQTVDFGLSSAMDNAGDVMGFCFPLTGKLLFLRHFAYYQSAPEHAVTYNVPLGSTIMSVTRSLIDGGFLFALNTPGAAESILVKTDSIGTLAGCSYQNIAIGYTEKINVPNITANIASSTTTFNQQPANATENTPSLLASFDCNQSYCPPAPIEDTCLASYFKRYRSNSYANGFGTYVLMRNNRHLLVTSRLNRLFALNTVSYDLCLFEENGTFIKGVTVFHDRLSVSMEIRKVDNRHALLIGYSNANTSYTLVNDDLQIIWSKSKNHTSTANSFAISNTAIDQEGNIYLYSTTGGYYEDSIRVGIHKMDASGNTLWTKLYSVQAKYLLGSQVTFTNTSLILVAEGPFSGSISLNINKTTGKLLNAYHFASNSGNYASFGVLKFQKDRIMFAGLTHENDMLIGLLDTTGKPLKFTRIPGIFNLRVATAKDGNLYVLGLFFNGVETKELFLKADSSLSVDFFNELDLVRPGFPTGMEVSDEGNIYVAGNYFYGGANGNYVDATFRKFDPNGVTGTCAYQPHAYTSADIDLQTISIPFAALPDGIVEPSSVIVDFIPDTYGNQVGELVCSSSPTCSSVKITGTNKVCQISQPFTYRTSRNAGCTIKPVWLYDTAFAVLQAVSDTTAEIRFKKFGNTWLKVKLNAGCSSFVDSFLVQVQQSPNAFSLGNDTAICKGSNLLLNAGNGFNSYLWQDGSANPVFTVTQPGTFFVSVENVCGQVYKDTIVVRQIVVPALNIGNDTSICRGDTLQLVASPGFSLYTWQPANSVVGQGANVYINTLQNITLSAIATTVEGCKAYDTLVVGVKTARPVRLGNDTSFCAGDSSVLSAGAGYLQYQWNNGALSQDVIIKQAGLYTVTATDVNGCKTKDSLFVRLYPLPVLFLGNDFNLCKGDQRQLDAGVFNQYLWQDGTTNRYYNTSTTGSYYVTVKDVNSCTASDTVLLKEILSLPANLLPSKDSICQYENITINVSGSFSSYLWSTGNRTPSIIVNTPGLYTLTVKDVSGCAGTDSIFVFQKDCFAGVFIPTAFSPNKDSRNDEFRATVYGSLVTYNLKVFNRYGQLVFITTDPQKGWDGTFKGVALPSSSFVWQCSYQHAGKLTRFIKGNVVLVR